MSQDTEETLENQFDAWGTVSAAMRRLTRADVDAMASSTGAERLGATLAELGLQLDPRFVRGGIGKLAFDRITRAADDPRAQRAVGPLLGGVVDEAQEFFGDESDNPSEKLVQAFWTRLSGRGNTAIVTVLYAYVVATEMPAADHCSLVLTEQVPDAIVHLGSVVRADPLEETGEEAGEDEADEPWVGIGDAMVFTPLDEVLIRTITDAVTGTVGSPGLPDVHRMIEELVRLNSARHMSWFHAGLLDAMDDGRAVDVPEAAMNDARRLWLQAGRVRGMIRRKQVDRLDELDRSDPPLMSLVLHTPATGRSIWGIVIGMLVEVRPLRAAELLGEWSQDRYDHHRTAVLLVRLHAIARQFLIDDRVPEARALWDSISAVTERMPGRAAWWAEIPRWLSACARADNDFARALSILHEGPVPGDPAQRALAETERGLVAAEIGHLRNVTTVRGGDHLEALAARLRRGEEHYRAALAIAPDEWRASTCLGTLALIDNDHTAAVRHLSMALSGMGEDSRVARSGLPAETRFNLALAKLRLLEPGNDGPAFGHLTMAIEEGFQPSREVAEEVLELLATHQSAHAGSWLEAQVDARGAHTVWAGHAVDLLRDGNRECRPAARRLAASARVGPMLRFELASLLVDTSDELAEDEVDDLLFELEELVRCVQHDEVTRAWASWLNGDTAARVLDRTQARLAEADAHRDLGAVQTAATIVEGLIHPALSDPTGPIDPDELFELYRQLDPLPSDVERLGRLVAAADRLEALDGRPAGPVHVVFVGGDERQSAYDREVDAILAEEWGDHLSIEWIHPGWSSNWMRFAERAEAQFARADVMVMMRFMRTNLGRRLRRSAGEAGLPWVQTPGHGRDAVVRGVRRGIDLAGRAAG